MGPHRVASEVRAGCTPGHRMTESHVIQPHLVWERDTQECVIGHTGDQVHLYAPGPGGVGRSFRFAIGSRSRLRRLLNACVRSATAPRPDGVRRHRKSRPVLPPGGSLLRKRPK